MPYSDYFKIKPGFLDYIYNEYYYYDYNINDYCFLHKNGSRYYWAGDYNPYVNITDRFPSVNLSPYVNSSSVPIQYWEQAYSTYSVPYPNATQLYRRIFVPSILSMGSIGISIFGGIIMTVNEAFY